MPPQSRPPLVGIRLPEEASFARDICAGVADFMQETRPWRIATPRGAGEPGRTQVIDEHWQGDGLIVFRYTPQEAEAWLSRGVRVVNCSAECLDPRIPAVTPDNRGVGRLAAEHLASRGLKHFAFWENPDRRYSRERLAGFSEELARRKFSCESFGAVLRGKEGMPPEDRIAMTMDFHLARLRRPCGILAKDDRSALGLLRSCERLGLRVPEDIAILGCGDDFMTCHTADAPLSSVRYPARGVGRRLAAALESLLTGGATPPERAVVPVDTIVTRESTNLLLHTHPRVRQALGIILRSAPETPLHVQEVADLMSASKAGLQRSFHEEVGMTMKEYIDRVRTETLRKRLEGTSLPIKAIAKEMHFESQEELSRFFRRTGGMSPSEYRRLHCPASGAA